MTVSLTQVLRAGCTAQAVSQLFIDVCSSDSALKASSRDVLRKVEKNLENTVLLPWGWG